MEIKLDQTQKAQLEQMHARERDVLVCDRIKAVLLASEGWTNRQIAQALRIHEITVATHLADFLNLNKLKPENGGSKSKLNEVQTSELIAFLMENTFTTVFQIQQYIFCKYQVSYGIQGTYSWLINHDFSYKKPKLVPAKANQQAQEEFLIQYQEIKEQAKQENEPIFFIDSVHPTMATKVSYGWIRKGTNKTIKATASRTRINLSGAIDLKAIKVITDSFETINGASTVTFLQQIRKGYEPKRKLHIILDNSGYHTSDEVKKFSEENNIKLHFLPPYSPNLNPIERLWKLMNEHVRNNHYFQSPKEFRQKIHEFFANTIPKIPEILRSRITDNFQVVGLVSSG